MTSRCTTLEKISAARPVVALYPELQIGDEEQNQLLASILDSASIDLGRSTSAGRPRGVKLGVAAIGMAATALGVGLVSSGTVVNPMEHRTGNRDATGGPVTSGTTTAVAAIKAHLTAALTNVSDIESTQSQFNLGANGVDTENRWSSSDGNTVRVQTFLNGQEEYDETMVTINGVTNATVVDITNRSWWTWSEPAGSPPTAASSLSPASIQRDVEDGTLHVVSGNHQTVDGHETIEMSGNAAQSAVGLGTFDLWVDSSTYLPVRSENSGIDRTSSSSEFKWLVPTATNLALLQVAVPSGFSHSPVPLSPPTAFGGGLG